MFEKVGKRIQNKKPATPGLARKSELHWSVRLGVSFRLFARLPIDEEEGDTVVFCPAAALPAKRWLNQALQEASSEWYKFEGDELVIVSSHLFDCSRHGLLVMGNFSLSFYSIDTFQRGQSVLKQLQDLPTSITGTKGPEGSTRLPCDFFKPIILDPSTSVSKRSV